MALLFGGLALQFLNTDLCDSGVDPLVGTVGSITWGQRLVDGTAVKFIDPREMPKALQLHRLVSLL